MSLTKDAYNALSPEDQASYLKLLTPEERALLGVKDSTIPVKQELIQVEPPVRVNVVEQEVPRQSSFSIPQKRGIFGRGRKRLKEGDRCKRGHLVVGDNAYEYSPGRYRCVRCHNEAAKKWQRGSRSVEYGGKLKQALEAIGMRSEEHTSELQSRVDLVCRLLLEKKNSTTLPPRGLQQRDLPRPILRAGR